MTEPKPEDMTNGDVSLAIHHLARGLELVEDDVVRIDLKRRLTDLVRVLPPPKDQP